MAKKEEVRARVIYKTDNETWAKVVMVNTHENINNRCETLDFLVKKGFEAWQNEQNKKE